MDFIKFVVEVAVGVQAQGVLVKVGVPPPVVQEKAGEECLKQRGQEQSNVSLPRGGLVVALLSSISAFEALVGKVETARENQ